MRSSWRSGAGVLAMACVVLCHVAHAEDSARSSGVHKAELNTPGQLLASGQGRDVLRYIVQCALPAGQELTTKVDGQTHTFAGAMGLAPNWAKGPLNASDQRWVSACVLSRVNFFGVPVPISLQGDHAIPELRTRGDESRDFTIEEGAFYGNIFLPDAVAYVCKGRGPMPKDNPWVGKRVCTEVQDGSAVVTKCNFILAGACADVCATRNAVSGAYEKCKAPDGQVYSEVLTTYLRNH